MADTYTLKEYTEEELVSIDDKDKIVTRAYSENYTLDYTIRKLEQGIANCDADIKIFTDKKASLQVILDLVKAKVDE